MRVLNNEHSETVEEVKKPDTSFESLLKDYGQPAEVAETETGSDNNSPGNASIETESENVQPGHWQGNPAYYQTGKKAGQKRVLKTGPKLSYIKSEEISEIDGELITGALFLSMIDLLLPLLITGIHNSIVKKKEDKLKWDSIQLTSEQKKQLSPIADKVVKQIKLQGHPVLILSLTMLGLYCMQFAIAKFEQKSK